MKVSVFMSVFYHASFSIPEIDYTPAYYLWGGDPYLSSRLLAAIQGEALNRKLPIRSFYDTLSPSLLRGLWVEGIGNFIAPPYAPSLHAHLIDCSPLTTPSPEQVGQLREIAVEKQQQSERIGQMGACLQGQIDLRKELSIPMVRLEELTHRALRIAQKVKRGKDQLTILPILSYIDGKEVYRLPFDEGTQIIGISGQYDLPALFLNALLSALANRPCERVVLENALTHEAIGVWLPTEERCYLLHAPEDLCKDTRSLNRYLCPHTQAYRHSHRALRSACDAWRERLLRLLGEHQQLCAREEALYTPLYDNNRLQSFRKRLLIDLFC